MEIILIGIVILILLRHSYELYKQKKANRELNELYMKRFGEAERTEKLIREKPDNVILMSEAQGLDLCFTYIGSLDNLGRRVCKNGDYASKDGRTYLYMDGKWLEMVDDIPHIHYVIGDY